MLGSGPRKPSVLAPLGFGLPFGLVLLMCLLLRREAASLVAPILGPWAGVLYGHHGCTLATQWPTATWVLVITGAALVICVLGLRGRPGYPWVLTGTALWAAAWETTALLSVANTCS
jgi:hypothetical protein